MKKALKPLELCNQRSYQVLLLIETSRAYGRGLVKGIARYALEQNWFIHFHDRGLAERVPSYLKNWNGDGIITRTASPKLERILEEKKIPFVEMLGRKHPEVCSEETKIGQMAAEHFIERGFKQFAYFSLGHPWWSKWRGGCFERAIKCFGGGTIDRFHQKKSNSSQIMAWNALSEAEITLWLKKPPKPIGIFCSTDMYAVTLLGYCRKWGIAVPEEVAILGTDNDDTLCNITTPKISSIDVNSPRIGYLAAHLLHQKLLGKANNIVIPITVPPPFVVTRQSTDMIAIEDEDLVQAIRYIRENATVGITVVDVTQHVGLSQATISRSFPMRRVAALPDAECLSTDFMFEKQEDRWW